MITFEALIQAIKDADKALIDGENVGLLYYMEDYCENQVSTDLVREILKLYTDEED